MLGAVFEHQLGLRAVFADDVMITKCERPILAVLLNLCTIFHACTPCPARWTKLKKNSQPQFQGDSADRGAIANHDVASSSYCAAFEHVAGFIKENVLNVSQTVCSVSITSLCDIFTSELRERVVEPRSVVSFN